jgi:glycosyltransferase involved in cell wall biosynthesis
MSGSSRTILLVIGALDVGGTETQLLRTVPRLVSAERRFTVLTLSRRGALADEFQARGVPVDGPWLPTAASRSGGIMRGIRTASSALQLLVRLLFARPDIVHFILPHAYWLGGTLACLTGVRGRIMSRRSLNTYLKTRPPLFAWLERRLHRRMSLIIGNSRAIVEELVREEGAPPERTVVIYNGIDLAEFAPRRDRKSTRDELGVPGGAVLLCIVANLIPYKGHADLLHACAALDEGPEWRLLVVGEDTSGHGAALLSLAAQLGLARRVHFLGRRADVADLLAASDVGVLASHEEGLPNAVLEYMACSLAVVATAVGGTPELVVQEETGLLVPPRDPEALSAALRRVVADPGLRGRLGAAGRRRVRELFAIERTLERYAAAYEEVGHSRRPG